MGMNNNKKMIKVVIYALFVLVSIGFTSFPKTYSSFSYKDDDVLVYRTQLYNLYDEYSMKLELSTIDSAQFRFSFKPNSAVSKSEKDKYDVSIPEGCTLVKATKAGVPLDVDKQSRSLTFSYDVGSDRDGVNLIYITCPVGANSDSIEFISNINETVGEEDSKEAFLYIQYSYKEKYDDYLEHVNSVDTSKQFPGSDDLYNKFKEWITSYGRYIGYEREIWDYVRHVYPDENALKDSKNFNVLPGFSIEYSNKEDEYTFNILSNFLGYARTYDYNQDASTDNIFLYFSTKSKGELDLALKNYLKIYVYPDNQEAVQMVYDYIYRNNRIYSVIFENNKISGLQLKEYQEKNTCSKVLIDKATIFSTAASYAKGIPHIAFGSPQTMLTSFQSGLISVYKDIPESVLKEIYFRSDIQASVTKNNTGTTPKSFVDYFIHPNGSRYLLIKVSSDIERASGYNAVVITPFAVPSGMEITFENTNENVLTVKIIHTSKSSVMQTADDLSDYFKKSYEDLKVLTNTSNEYSVQFTIRK